MPIGKVKEYDASRGCGRIVDAAGHSFIVYANFANLGKGETLIKGQDVTFEIKDERHGNWAINIKSV